MLSVSRVAVVAFSLSLFTVPAFAQDVTQACQADIARLCAGATGEDAIDDCLDENEAQLSQACNAALDATDDGEDDEGEDGAAGANGAGADDAGDDDDDDDAPANTTQ